jgi:cytidylate kinase
MTDEAAGPTAADAPSPTEPADRGRIVSLDGPGSSGKSSVGAAAAERLGYRFCDTGLLYRALTWLALERGADLDNGAALADLESEVMLADSGVGRLDRVLVDGRDVTPEVHTPRVDAAVSQVSQHPEVRAGLLERQRAIARAGRIIMAGRDIGTVVLPDADLRLYLDVSVAERARRRAEERGVDPESVEGRRILADLERRDRIDRERATAPLRVPDGAVVIRTDGNSFEQTVDAVVDAILRAEEASGG